MKRSKKYQEALKKIEKNKVYPIEEAVKLVKEVSFAKFDASIDLHLRLGIDPKKGDQLVRGTVILPHGIGGAKKIIAFVEDEAKEKEAKEAGADIVGGKELVDEIKKTKKVNFDIAVATPTMMKVLAPIAKILGPKGLMPSPKNETITTDLKKTIGELKKGKISFKNDDTANLHQTIAKVSWDDKKIIENFKAFLETVLKAKPAGAKGTYLKAIYLSPSMGPSVKTEFNK